MIIFLILASLAAMQIKEVKLYVFAKLSEIVEEKTGYTISVDDLELMLPFEVKLSNLTIESENGDSLKAGRTIIRINPSSLIEKQLHLHSVSLRDVTLNQKAPIHIDNEPSRQPIAIGLNKLPLYLAIPQFTAQNVTIHSEQLSEISGVPIDLKAQLNLDPINKTVSIGAKVIDHVDTGRYISADINLVENQNNLVLDIQISEAKGGFLNLPKEFSIDASAHLIGSIESWNTLLNQQTSSDRVIGEIKIQYKFDKTNTGQLTGNAYLSSQKGLELNDIEGFIDNIGVKGDLFYHPMGQLDGSQLVLSVVDISSHNYLFNKNISGPVEADLSFSGTLQAPSFRVYASSEKLDIEGTSLANVNMELKGTYYTNSCFDTKFEFNINEPEDQIHLSSAVTWCMGDLIDIKNLNISHPSAKVQGDLAYSIMKNEFDGSINGKINELKILENFIPHQFRGELNFDAALKHEENGGQTIEMNLNADNALVDNISLEGLSGLISIADAYERPDGLIDFSVKKLSVDDAHFENIHLVSCVNEEKKAWPFELSFGGNTVVANGEGFLEYTSQSLQVTLDTFKGHKSGHDFNLIAPISLQLKRNKTELSPFVLNVGNGFLQATLSMEDRNNI
ncbi:MAG: hypothetical protein AAGG81_02355, partial [Chlamydiota bacterium]